MGVWILLLGACDSDGGPNPVAGDTDARTRPERLRRVPTLEAGPPFVPPPGDLPDYVPVQVPGAFLYEEGTIHDFRIELDGSARARLALDPRDDVHAGFEY